MALAALTVSRVPFLQSNSRQALLPVGVFVLLGLGILILSTQRQLFALKPTHNYYHWLIVDESIRNSSLPKVYSGDHLYFPNQSFPGKENSFLWIDCDDMQRTYKAFSLGVKTIKTDEINEMKHFILIHDKTEQDSLNGINAERTDIKRRMLVNKHSKFFADEIQLKRKSLE